MRVEYMKSKEIKRNLSNEFPSRFAFKTAVISWVSDLTNGLSTLLSLLVLISNHRSSRAVKSTSKLYICGYYWAFTATEVEGKRVTDSQTTLKRTKLVLCDRWLLLIAYEGVYGSNVQNLINRYFSFTRHFCSFSRFWLSRYFRGENRKLEGRLPVGDDQVESLAGRKRVQQTHKE